MLYLDLLKIMANIGTVLTIANIAGMDNIKPSEINGIKKVQFYDSE
jgi:hypothetical protein